MRDYEVMHNGSGRPRSERDGECICDYNPETTQGPEEDCPFHGREYSYWIKRGDELAQRLSAAEAAIVRFSEDNTRLANLNDELHERLDAVSAAETREKEKQ